MLLNETKKRLIAGFEKGTIVSLKKKFFSEDQLEEIKKISAEYRYSVSDTGGRIHFTKSQGV